VTPLEVLRRYQAHDYTLLGVLASRARAVPEHSFMEFGDARLTYSQTLASECKNAPGCYGIDLNQASTSFLA
jgi:hypothetical protein